MPDFLLRLNQGPWLSAEALGVSLQTLEIQDSAPDVLTFSTARPDDFRPRGWSGPPGSGLAPPGRISLAVDGVCRFVGEIEFPREERSAAVGHESVVQAFGPWRIFENWPFVREFFGTSADTGRPAFVESLTLASEVNVFYSPSGPLMPSGAQALAALQPVAYRLDYFYSLNNAIDRRISIDPMPADLIPPAPVPVSAASVAEVVRLCDRWVSVPVVRWFDYAAHPLGWPVLKTQAAGYVGDWIAPTSSGTEAETVPAPDLPLVVWEGFSSLSGQRRVDLQATSVVLRSIAPGNYLQVAGSPSFLTDRVMWVECGAVGILPSGTAAQVYGGLPAGVEGAQELPQLEMSARPGHFCSRSMPGSDLAMVRSVMHDLRSLRTTLRIGPPRQLGAKDFIQLSALGRRLRAL